MHTFASSRIPPSQGEATHDLLGKIHFYLQLHHIDKPSSNTNAQQPMLDLPSYLPKMKHQCTYCHVPKQAHFIILRTFYMLHGLV